MRKHSISSRRAALVIVGTTLGIGALTLPAPAVAAPSTPTGIDLGCLPLLCDEDGDPDGDLDLDVDLDLDIGGDDEPAPPSEPIGGGLADDLVDVDLDLDLDADAGDAADVRATVPLDTRVSTERGVDIEIDTSPDVAASVLPDTVGAEGDVAGVDVTGVDVGIDLATDPTAFEDSVDQLLRADLDELRCVADLVVVDASQVQCAGDATAGADAGLVGAAVTVGICNVSVTLLDEATSDACLTDDGTDDDGTDDDGSDDDGSDDDGTDDDGTDDDGTDDDGSDDDGTDDGDGSGVAGDGFDGPQGAATPSQTAEGDELAVTGAPLAVTLGLAAGLTVAGAAALGARRRRSLGA